MNSGAKLRLQERISAFPAMPGNASRVLQVLRDPKASAANIERVVSLDPGLTANILRYANSAFVGLRGKVGSLREAVVHLGLQRLQEMTVAASVNSMMVTEVPGYEVAPGEMWRHAIGVAVGAELLARDQRMASTGDAFTAGLLHDIGKLVAGEWVGEHWQELDTHSTFGHSFDDAERAVLGMDHGQCGADILEHWGLPRGLCAAVRYHHRPDQLPDPEGLTHDERRLVDLVHLADGVALMLGFNDGREGLSYAIHEPVAERLGMDDRKIEAFAARLLVAAEEMIGVVDE